MFWQKHVDVKCLQCSKQIGVATKKLTVLCSSCQMTLTLTLSKTSDDLDRANYELGIQKENLRISKQTNKLLLEEVARRSK